MSKFNIYVELKPFIRQWAVHHFGSPIVFPSQSAGNARIVAVLRRRPEDAEPDISAPDLTPVAIPYSKQKDPEAWNYVTPSGRRFIAEYIEALFQDNLYSEFKEMCGDDGRAKLQTAAYTWCEMHGISIDYADTIRQRFYRERERLLARGVDLRKRSRNKSEKNEKKYQ
ncbi:MAG: hypothetical protein ILA39_07015 [Bacteroidaceae bacterium]|nr:hypothetical protein [Bacteroidaceae bacterium]MBQ6188779.1 hypothetical protein [Bacteroidaceae bacterium]